MRVDFENEKIIVTAREKAIIEDFFDILRDEDFDEFADGLNLSEKLDALYCAEVE